MKLPRIMLVAPSSGSGKTLVTCGILQALVDRGLNVASFKCGPDFIDPLFHGRVIGTKSSNLDSFFTGPDVLRYLFGNSAKGSDISVIEGVMGFYDGIDVLSMKASSYEISNTLNVPVVLIIDCKGASSTIAASVKGLKEFRANNISGVILNRVSTSIYEDIKGLIESETGLKVIGHVPNVKELTLESRHLGLVLPNEIESLKKKLKELARILEESLDMDLLIRIANTADDLDYKEPRFPIVDGRLKIAVAADDAFCFTYNDNLRILEKMGAEIVDISPIHDRTLPADIDGIILSGGYPELHAKELSENRSMRRDMFDRISKGLPCIAECGGFMYLNKTIEDRDGEKYEMVNLLDGDCFRTDKLVRFGYVSIRSVSDELILRKNDTIKGHEFHYWDCTDNGDSCIASEIRRKREYTCIQGGPRIFAGFPHLYYYSNPDVPYNFLRKCLEYRKERLAE
ncbi:MAG: cobyrinate a,c-diamide synthase [Candidatus Methanomethylophilaceae archaeon]